MNTENKQEFTNAEYQEKIRQAEIELERVRLASIEYLETLAEAERAVKERREIDSLKPKKESSMARIENKARKIIKKLSKQENEIKIPQSCTNAINAIIQLLTRLVWIDTEGNILAKDLSNVMNVIIQQLKLVI